MPELKERLTRLDGTLIAELPDEDAARKVIKKLEREGTSYRWERWCGERTGFNSVREWLPVAGFIGPDRATAQIS
jgi:hypothetical protein